MSIASSLDERYPELEHAPIEARDWFETTRDAGSGLATFARSPNPVRKEHPEWWKDTNKKYLSMSLPIYALRHRNRPGIGKFTDLARTYRSTLARQGIDTIVLLPPFHSTLISPYSPVSLYALNELYIDWTVVPEIRNGPDLELARTLIDPRWVHYEDEFERLSRLRLAAYRAFRQNADLPRRQRFREFLHYQVRNRNWLDEYAWFMAERNPTPDTSLTREAADAHMFAQWIAYNQFKVTIDEIHAAGGHIAVDIPLFRSCDGVDNSVHPEYFRHGHPGAGGQIWGDQALWNWEKLRTEQSKFLLDPMEHWLDFGCDAIRVDAAANSYKREGQTGSGDEDGDRFMADLGKVFRDRDALALVEVLSAPEVTTAIEREGMLALYRDWQVYSTHDFMNSDLSQNPENFLQEIRSLLRTSDEQRGHKGALFVNLTFLDVEGDPYKLKRVEYSNGQAVSVWETQMSLPSDPDHRVRARWDRGADLARIVAEETGRAIPQETAAPPLPNAIPSNDARFDGDAPSSVRVNDPFEEARRSHG